VARKYGCWNPIAVLRLGYALADWYQLFFPVISIRPAPDNSVQQNCGALAYLTHSW